MAVHLRLVGPVLVVTIDRPERRNAFDGAMIVELRELFEGLAYKEAPQAVADTAVTGAAMHDMADWTELECRPHVVLLRSTGPVFCAGADLDDMKRLGAADFQQNLDAALEMGAMFRAIRNCPAPVVGRVQGPAFGGGVGLACSCDLVVAGLRARFTLTEVRLGLVAGVIAPLVIGRIGPAAARAAMLTAEPIAAERARQLGLVDRLATAENRGPDDPDDTDDHGRLDALVEQTVQSLLAGGPAALGMTKGLIEGSLSLGYNRSSEFTAKLIAEARTGDEAQAALQAFFSKQPAPWSAAAGWTYPEGGPIDDTTDESDGSDGEDTP